MSAEKTLGIILKVVSYSETSCIVTLLTESFGRISGMAKGARRPKGPFDGAIDILSLSQVMFLPRRNASLDLLTEAKLERRFRPCEWSLARLYAGYYLAELLLEMTQPHQDVPELFRLTADILDRLQYSKTAHLENVAGPGPENQPSLAGPFRDTQIHKNNVSNNVSALILRFELQVLETLGQAPQLAVCTLCSQPIDIHTKTENAPQKRKVHFSFTDGGLVCRDCSLGRRDLILISSRSIQTLRRFADPQSFDWKSTSSQDACQSAVRQLMGHFWRYTVGHRLKLQAAVDQIAAKERRIFSKA